MDNKTQQSNQPDCIIKSTPFFYGYIVLIVGTIAKIMSSPGQSVCIGVVIGKLGSDLGYSNTIISILYLFATCTSAFSLPFAGKLITKLGQRLSISLISLGLGLSCLLFSQVHSSVPLFFSFFCLRFFGQGNIMSLGVTQINLWWVKQRGKIMGYATALNAACLSGLVPLFMNILMNQQGWRSVYETLGCIVLFIMLPLGFLFFRDSPEKYGLLPDGKVKKNKKQIVENNQEEVLIEMKEKNEENLVSEESVLEHNWTVKEMLHTWSFWAACQAQSVMAMINTAYYFHMRNVFEEYEIANSTVNMVYVFIGVLSCLSPIYIGHLSDRFQPHNLIIIAECLISVAQFSIPLSGTFPVFGPLFSSLFQALGVAFFITVGNTIFANYFGRENLPHIQSIVMSAGVLGSAFGPLPYAMVKDYYGGFGMAFTLGSMVPLISAFLVYKKGGHPGKKI